MLDKELTYSTSAGAKPGTTILTLEGPFTMGNMFQLQAEMRTLKPDCLILDLSGVPCYHVASEGGHRKFYVAGVNDRVRSLFEMTKVDAILRMFDSVGAAEAAA
jgi:anti-sigma B factor antagonist